VKPARSRYVLFFISLATVAVGEVAVWFLLPTIFDRLGGLNVISLSVGMLYFSVFPLVGAYLFRYGKGKPMQRWHVEVAQAYVGLAIMIALGFAYDALLFHAVIFIWPFIILPLVTMLGAFYLLRRIPRVRKKLDELSQNQ
jgi:hypothetical protein